MALAIDCNRIDLVNFFKIKPWHQKNRFTLETKYKIIQDRIKGKWNEEIVKIYRLKDSSNVSRICQQQKKCSKEVVSILGSKHKPLDDHLVK